MTGKAHGSAIPAMGALDHRVIMASAGTGKTYQLVVRYLSLLLHDVDPAHILATTFTRAAAAEIRDRIFERLASAAVCDKARAALASDVFGDDATFHDDADPAAPPLFRVVNEPRTLSRERVLDLLEKLAGNVHRMQVRTFDSFFAGVVRCFGYELGVGADASIVEDYRISELRRDAIRLMLDERDAQKLIDTLRRLIIGRADSHVTKTIEETVSSMRAVFDDSTQSAWELETGRWTLLSEDELAAALDETRDVVAGLKKGNLQKSAQDQFRVAAQARRTMGDDWTEFLTKGVSSKVLGGAKKFSRSTIPPELDRSFRVLINHALGAIRLMLQQRNQATWELLCQFVGAYDLAAQRMHAITFEDLTRLVARAAATFDLHDLFFRLDGRITHLLIDEMQDTNIPQWRAISPLVEEILATGPGAGVDQRTFFCVGDVKQSIYGWRAGRPELLEHIAANAEGRLEVHSIAESRRSSPIVLDVVNRVFASLETNETLADHSDAATAWSAQFQQHGTVRSELPGYVEVRSITSGDRTTVTQRSIEAGAELVKQLHTRNPTLSIGILTRTNDAVNHMLYELGPSRHNLNASGRGGSPLTDAPPVQAILDLLIVADHPSHTTAGFNVLRSPLGAHVDITCDFERDSIKGATRKLSEYARRNCQTLGLARFVGELAQAMVQHADPREARRLWELADLADAYQGESGSIRASGFVRAVVETNVADPKPAPIEVMTVHQAKGLEFDIVVLPQLESELARNDAKVVSHREGPAGDVTLASCTTSAPIMQAFDDIGPLRTEDHNRKIREGLNMLYVMMTRPRQGLYMLINPRESRSRSRSKSFSSVLRHALLNSPDNVEPERVVFSHGEESWIDNAGAGEDSREVWSDDEGGTKSDLALILPTLRARTMAALVRPSPADTASRGSQLREGLRSIPADSRDRGILWHGLFETIEWLDKGSTPDQAALVSAAARITSRRDRAWLEDEVHEFLQCLEHAEIRRVFQRPDDDPHATILHEHRFILSSDQGLQRGTIDRLVISTADASAARAQIIDFKTDAISKSKCTEAVARYSVQIAAYRAAVTAQFAIPEERIDAQLAFVNLGVVIEVE
ncbi:MAG: UvrD-helicase domain-containing protein [Phycisphaerales bacterium]